MTVMCTFNDMPAMLEEMQQTMKSMSATIVSMSNEIRSLKAQIAAKPSEPEALICGRFKRGEIVHMSDKRLWEGEGAPFRSRDAVRDSRETGCMWLTASKRDYCISAEDLRDYLLCKDLRKKLSRN